jgi:hypothetical protein
MPKVPDFEQIASNIGEDTGVGRLDEWDSGASDRVLAMITEQLRLVWNARGAADIAKLKAEYDETTTLADVIRALDR